MTSILKVDEVQLADGSTAYGNTLGIRNSVINTWHHYNNTRSVQNGSVNTWYSATDMALTFTPSRSDSKLFIQIHMCWSAGQIDTPGYSAYVRCLLNGAVDKRLNGNGKDTDGTGGSTTAGYSCFGQYRSSGGDHGNYHMDKSSLMALIDSPGTTAQTLQIQWRMQGNGYFHLNSDVSYGQQSSGSHQPNGISTITVQEIW